MQEQGSPGCWVHIIAAHLFLIGSPAECTTPRLLCHLTTFVLNSVVGVAGLRLEVLSSRPAHIPQ